MPMPIIIDNTGSAHTVGRAGHILVLVDIFLQTMASSSGTSRNNGVHENKIPIIFFLISRNYLAF